MTETRSVIDEVSPELDLFQDCLPFGGPAVFAIRWPSWTQGAIIGDNRVSGDVGETRNRRVGVGVKAPTKLGGAGMVVAEDKRY